MPTNVLIAGGGPAALEAALALHRLAGDRVATTLLAPEPNLTYRPLSVLSPFAPGRAQGDHGRRRAARVRRPDRRVGSAAGRAVSSGHGLHGLAHRAGAPARD